MTGSRRIPARRSQAFARWDLPSVGTGRVVKAEAARGERRIDAATAQAQAQPMPKESLESQLVDNIRNGRFATGVSARQLETIVRDAAREGREDGYREGFARGEQEGLVQGRAEGVAAGRAFIEDAAARLAGMIDGMQQPIAAQDAALRAAMVELVTRIARAVIRAELRLQPENIRVVVEQALAALPLGAAAVRVFVAPSDVELLADLGGAARTWTVLPDAALEPGDCRVEARESVVDYAVSARFAELLAQLLGPPTRESGQEGA
jgi:flagellar assembly protein FliH